MTLIEMKAAGKSDDWLAHQSSRDQGAGVSGDGRRGKPADVAVRDDHGTLDFLGERAEPRPEHDCRHRRPGGDPRAKRLRGGTRRFGAERSHAAWLPDNAAMSRRA